MPCPALIAASRRPGRSRRPTPASSSGTTTVRPSSTSNSNKTRDGGRRLALLTRDEARLLRKTNAAIAIADLHQRVTDLAINGSGQDTTPYKQQAAQLAKANCILVEKYPTERTNAPTNLGCRVFSGESRLVSSLPLVEERIGPPRTVYWTRCPRAVE
jgi:hypothetical protein